MALIAPIRRVHLFGQIGFKPGASGDICLYIRLRTRARFGELLMSLLVSFTISSESLMMLHHRAASCKHSFKQWAKQCTGIALASSVSTRVAKPRK